MDKEKRSEIKTFVTIGLVLIIIVVADIIHSSFCYDINSIIAKGDAVEYDNTVVETVLCDGYVLDKWVGNSGFRNDALGYGVSVMTDGGELAMSVPKLMYDRINTNDSVVVRSDYTYLKNGFRIKTDRYISTTY